MRKRIDLVGSDAEILQVAREAAALIAAKWPHSSKFFDQLWWLSLARRRFMARLGMSTQPATDSTSISNETAVGARYSRLGWNICCVLGVVSFFIGAAQLGPVDRKTSAAYPELAIGIAHWSFAIAIVPLLLAFVIRSPGAKSARYARVASWGALVVGGGLVCYRAVVGVSDQRRFSTEEVAAVLLLAAVCLALLLAMCVRLTFFRRAQAPAGGGAGAERAVRNEVRDLVQQASALAGDRTVRVGRAEWRAALDALRTCDVAAQTLEAAAVATPSEWLAWTCYDGEIDVSHLLAQYRGSRRRG